MTKKSTKRRLLASALTLIICVAMLVGTTFAWFTDSVTSAGNKIQSGTLKLDLELLDKETNSWSSIKTNQKPIFDYDLWEPGYTEVKILKVENEGSLALKWYAKFVSATELGILADVIDVYVKAYGVLSDDAAAGVTYPSDRNLEGYTKVGTVRDFVNTIETTTYGSLLAGEKAYLGLALKMQETAGNEYQDKTLGAFDIKILATQETYEEDNFDETYDEAANATMVSTADELVAAIAAGGEVALTEDIALSSTLAITKDTVIYGMGNTLTYTGSDRAITVAPVDDAVIDLTISNLTVDCSASYCNRAINYNETGSLVLNNVKVTGAPTYGINLQAMSDGVNVEINGGSYFACIPLNIWGENSVIVAKDVDFITVDNSDAEGYATIALNNDGTNSANGSVVTINGGSITVTGSNTNGSYAVRNNTATGVINISDSTKVTGETMHAVSVVKYDGTNDFYSHSTLQLSVECVEKYNSGWIVLLEDISIDTLKVNGDVAIVTDGHALNVTTYTGSGTLTVDGTVVYGN